MEGLYFCALGTAIVFPALKPYLVRRLRSSVGVAAAERRPILFVGRMPKRLDASSTGVYPLRATCYTCCHG